MPTLQFVATRGVTAAMIEWFDHGPYSHVDAVLPDGRLLGARFDAVGGAAPGVQIRPPAYEMWSAVKRIEMGGSAALDAAWVAFLMGQLGKPYDDAAIAGFAAGRDWRDTGAWFCSELQAAALEQAGWFPWPLASPAAKIAPSDLLLAVSARVAVML